MSSAIRDAITTCTRLLAIVFYGAVPSERRFSHRYALVSAGVAVLALLGGFLPLLSGAQLQVPAGTDQVRRSFSGQFVVSLVLPKGQQSRFVSNLETNAEYIRLDPTLLPVSCERIKQSLARQLGLNTAWMGRIFISLYRAGTANDSAVITSGQFRDGWQYRVELPDVVKRAQYVRAIVQTLLMETANRTAVDHGAEIPAWLTEGLTQRILLSSEMEVILPPPNATGNGFSVATTMVNARNENPMEIVHKLLCANAPLTFQQLSWPEFEQLEGHPTSTFSPSAYLFVEELLQLKDGRGCLRAMLALLPRHYNWQFAFLEGFRGYFSRPLDVEKWWTLHLEQFTGRELSQTWSGDESWYKLDELVRSAVQVRTGTNEMPLHAEVKLQTIVSEWDRARQDPALRQKQAELQMLRLRLNPELALLADDYRRALADYVQARDHGGLPLLKKAARRHALQDTLRRLDELDARRLQLKPLGSPATIQANTAAR